MKYNQRLIEYLEENKMSMSYLLKTPVMDLNEEQRELVREYRKGYMKEYYIKNRKRLIELNASRKRTGRPRGRPLKV